MSFAKAAEELRVTPAALSFQIKSLEDHIGVPMFKRLNRAVELTEEGRLLQPGVSDGFAALQLAWSSVKRRLEETILTVTAGPGFTAKWLAPRLFSFAQANPDIELRFAAGLRIMDFARDDIDVAIRFGRGGDDASLYSRPIIKEWSIPMMTPELAHKVKIPEDLRALPLLHQDDTQFLKPDLTWDAYFDAVGIGPASGQGTRFSQADHAVDAALAGAGAVLGRASLTEAHLREGRLVMPLKQAIWAHADYRIVCPIGTETRPHVARFIDWVLEETASIARLADTVEIIDRT
ncbi:LysR family transcriptional regulator [Litoreibacter roseus]|uniref:LysR family transcriptional regulator n=2 Tax=Litoreibacter roseus TaxID=2601869 RepID=A0A6N6JLT8_9RHOB|nr:LysR family transcriptional regulator [Litoreibacter roseus]